MTQSASRLSILLAAVTLSACSVGDATASEAPLPNPLANSRFYVDGASGAARQAESWARSRPTDAGLLAYIAAQPQAKWIGDWSGDVRAEVARTVAAAGSTVPVLVAYNIPARDCGQWSKGGASADGYRSWVRAFGEGIGNHRAVVILEPDALALTDCLSEADRNTRFELLRYAIETLSARRGVAVYVDAGHARWHAPAQIAERLRAVGAEKAAGFALNVSNYVADGESVAYGEQVSRALGDAHFVVDSSRNGAGADGEWCNPAGRALGRAPTAQTGNELVDAYLWVKRPGESDGECNGGPRAGEFWAEYALGLAQRAGVTERVASR